MLNVDKLLQDLELEERKNRLKAAEALSDYAEFANLNTDDWKHFLQKMVITATGERDYEIQETLLHGIANALLQRDCTIELNLMPLVQSLSDLKGDCLLHAIDIIGLLRNKKYVESVKPFLKHSRFEVREASTIALEEMTAC